MTTEDNRTSAVLSLTIRGIERDLERTPSGRGGIISFKPATPGIGGSGTPGDNLLADWRELEATLAAERDRADRAEATIADALEWVGKVGGEGAAYEILSDYKATA